MKDLTDSLVLDLDMETLKDYSGNSNDGTASGTSLTTDKDNKLNKARSFNGTSDYIQTPIWSEITQAYTISYWIKSSSTSLSWVFGAKDTGFDNVEGGINYPSSGNVFFQEERTGGNKIINSTSSFNDGKWHNITCTSTGGGGTMTIYFDGVSEDSDTTDSGVVGIGANDWLAIGGQNQNGSITAGTYINADISDFKVWNRALSADEAKQLYLETKHNYQGLFDGLVAGYDFKGDAKDFSGNGNDGTVTGASITSNKFDSSGAYNFDAASSEYITFGTQFATNDELSYSLWFKTSSTQNYLSLFFDQGDVSSEGTWVRLEPINTRVRALVHDGTGADDLIYSTSALNDGNWHNVIVVFDSGASAMYIDGSVGDTDVGTFSGVNSNNTPRIGATSALAAGEYFDGDIGQFHFWHRALSSDEAKQFYDLSSKNYVYPYPQHRKKGITE